MRRDELESVIRLKRRVARHWAVVGSTGLAAVIVLLSVYLWFTRGEVQENRYASYGEARGAQLRGWLPTILPRSAAEIHEWHDLDTNLFVGSFRFDPRERSRMVAGLRPGSRRVIRIDRDPSFASPLPRDPGEKQLTSAGFEIYSGQDFDFAINWKAGMAYVWSSPS